MKTVKFRRRLTVISDCEIDVPDDFNIEEDDLVEYIGDHCEDLDIVDEDTIDYTLLDIEEVN